MHRSVKILYAGSRRKKALRTVEPLKLMYKSKAWYLKAYCLEKEAFRLFKLNRILEWELLEESFTPVPFPKPDAAPESDSPQTEPPQVVLSFPGEMAYRVYDEFDSCQVKELENGGLLAAAPMPVDEWLIGFLLSFGSEVEIIEPAYLKNILAERALKIYEKYKT